MCTSSLFRLTFLLSILYIRTLGTNIQWLKFDSTESSPLLSYLLHSFLPLLPVLVLLGVLLGRVLLHALSNGLVVFGNVVEEPLQAFLDGLVDLLAVA